MVGTRALWPVFPSAPAGYSQHNENEFRRAVEQYVRQEVERALVAAEDAGVTYDLTDQYLTKYDAANDDLADSLFREDYETEWANADAVIGDYSGDNWFGHVIRHLDDSDGDWIGYEVHEYGAGVPYHQLTRYKGTYASPTAVQNNDSLGIYYFAGYDGADLGGYTSIQAEAEGNFTTTAQATRMRFVVTLYNSTTEQEIFRVTPGDATHNPGLTVKNGYELKWRNAGDTDDIEVLWVDGSDDTILAADSGNNLKLMTGALTGLTVNASTAFVNVHYRLLVAQDVYVNAGRGLLSTTWPSYSGFQPESSAAGYSKWIARASATVCVDADNNSSSARFIVKSDTNAPSTGGTELLEVNEAGWIRLLPTAGGSRLYSGGGVPSGLTNEADGDFFFRTDGGAGTSLYVRISSTWTAIA